MKDFDKLTFRERSYADKNLLQVEFTEDFADASNSMSARDLAVSGASLPDTLSEDFKSFIGKTLSTKSTAPGYIDVSFINCSSVNTERCFSSAKYYLSDRRGRMSDYTIGTLIFLYQNFEVWGSMDDNQLEDAISGKDDEREISSDVLLEEINERDLEEAAIDEVYADSDLEVEEVVPLVGSLFSPGSIGSSDSNHHNAYNMDDTQAPQFGDSDSDFSLAYTGLPNQIQNEPPLHGNEAVNEPTIGNEVAQVNSPKRTPSTARSTTSSPNPKSKATKANSRSGTPKSNRAKSPASASPITRAMKKRQQAETELRNQEKRQVTKLINAGKNKRKSQSEMSGPTKRSSKRASRM